VRVTSLNIKQLLEVLGEKKARKVSNILDLSEKEFDLTWVGKYHALPGDRSCCGCSRELRPGTD
jgi:hypothetical protein